MSYFPPLLLPHSFSVHLHIHPSYLHFHFSLHPAPSMQQCSHQHEGAACEQQRSSGALGSSRSQLPSTHPTLPGVIQLDISRRQLRGDAPHWCQTQTGKAGTNWGKTWRGLNSIIWTKASGMWICCKIMCCSRDIVSSLVVWESSWNVNPRLKVHLVYTVSACWKVKLFWEFTVEQHCIDEAFWKKKIVNKIVSKHGCHWSTHSKATTGICPTYPWKFMICWSICFIYAGFFWIDWIKSVPDPMEKLQKLKI